MAKGFSQKEGIDYEETFALVVRYTSIRAVISLSCNLTCSTDGMANPSNGCQDSIP